MNHRRRRQPPPVGGSSDSNGVAGPAEYNPALPPIRSRITKLTPADEWLGDAPAAPDDSSAARPTARRAAPAFDVYETIARIRTKPGMYLGEPSLVRLHHFLNGCFFMAAEFGIGTVVLPAFSGLHDWMAARFGRRESTAGWCNILLDECGGNDAAAFHRFFELLDEYRRTAG